MEHSQPFRFAVSATFTAEPIQATVAFWGRRLNSDFEIRFAPYNQPLQTILDPTSVFATNQHGVNVLLLRIEDFGEAGPQLEANLQQLASVIRESPAHLHAPLIVVVCPASPGAHSTAQESAAHLAARLEDAAGVQILRAEEIARLYPVDALHSPEGERLGRIPYTEIYFCALGTAVVRLAHSLVAPTYKVIALDCDNTLWQGICGEDGPAGVVLDAPRSALQRFMADQREQGMLLVLASKNNEPDVAETFEQHPEMPLQLRHFAGWRLNWDPKASSLSALADELSLGLDSFIFVDDNPKECAEVEDSLPEVLALALPANPVEIPQFLQHVWAFDHPAVTEEDRNRNAYYAQAQQFGRELKQSASLTHFMESLDLQVNFEPITEGRLARAAQLTQRTNQFNFTGARRTEAEIQSCLDKDGCQGLTVYVTDRFGDYGLVGVILYRINAGMLDVDSLLLSCRALGRGVEHRMLAHLGELAVKQGAGGVRLNFVPAKRNQPARQFLEEIGFDLETQAPLDARELTRLEWKPGAQPVAKPPSAPRPEAAHRRFVEFSTIARDLATPVQILDAMRRESGNAASLETASIEQRLAAIWADLLQRPSVKSNDNFFDLGGHSLLAVLLVMRVRETFGVELPIGDVYSASLTLGELARKIEAYQTGEVSPAEYDALLAEIEGLSDEEVQRLLAEEDPGTVRP